MTPGVSEHIGQVGGGWWGCGFGCEPDFDDDLRLEASVQKTNVCGGVADWEGFDLGGVGCEVLAETEPVSERDLAGIAQSVVIAAALSAQNTLIKVAIDTDGDLSKADWDSIVSDYTLNQSVSALGTATSTGLGSMAESGGGGEKAQGSGFAVAELDPNPYDAPASSSQPQSAATKQQGQIELHNNYLVDKRGMNCLGYAAKTGGYTVTLPGHSIRQTGNEMGEFNKMGTQGWRRSDLQSGDIVLDVKGGVDTLANQDVNNVDVHAYRVKNNLDGTLIETTDMPGKGPKPAFANDPAMHKVFDMPKDTPLGTTHPSVRPGMLPNVSKGEFWILRRNQR